MAEDFFKAGMAHSIYTYRQHKLSDICKTTHGRNANQYMKYCTDLCPFIGE